MPQIDPFASGVLDKSVHDMLVKNIANYASDAGIQPHWVWTPLGQVCSPAEVMYAVKFKAQEVAGLVYVGSKLELDVPARMSALAGCLVRNFIRARVVTLSTFLEDGYKPEISCLMIPNFFLSKAEGGSVAPWQVQVLYDQLLARQIAGLQTVLYVSDLDAMSKEYGVSLGKFVKQNYSAIKG